MSKQIAMSSEPTFVTSLVAGGIAGLCVDVSLFPIDTVKTRLQAPEVLDDNCDHST